MATMEELLTHESVQAIRACIIEAVDRHGFDLVWEMKAQGLTEEKLSNPYQARLAFDGLLKIIKF